MKALTLSHFIKELSKEGNSTLFLRMEQLSNEYPLYSSMIMSAFARVASSRI